jgi:hypothetical protein
MIYINIPKVSRKGKPYKIPKFLQGLTNVKIRTVKKDIGPATKLLPLMKHEKDVGNGHTRIIVVDDDKIYGSKLVETLIKEFEARDGKVAITNLGLCLDDNRMPSYGALIANALSGNRMVDILTGCGGFIVTPDLFPDQVYVTKGCPKACDTVDDIWFSGWLQKNGVQIYQPPFSFRRLYMTCIGTQGTALSRNENACDNNNICLDWFKLRHGMFPR